MERAQTSVKAKVTTNGRSSRTSRKQGRLRQNQAVLRVIQGNEYPASLKEAGVQAKHRPVSAKPEVSVSQPSDALEQEADRVAHQVLARSEQDPSQSLCDTCDEEQVSLQRDISEHEQDETLQLQTSEYGEEDVFHGDAAEEDKEQVNRLCDECNHEVDPQASKLQRAVVVSQPDDPLEKEADRVATEVLQAKPMAETTESLPVNAIAESTSEEELQRLCDECEQEVEFQRKTTSLDQPGAEKPGLWQRIKAVFRGGRKIPGKIAQFFSDRMGYDISNVTIHTDQQAAETAEAINARAYTYQDHVVFARDAYQPDSHAGRHLLGHELTHVIQQGAAPQVHETAVSPQISTAQNPSVSSVQRDEDDSFGGRFLNTVNDIGNRISGAAEVGVDMIWSVVERVAPRQLMNLIREVQQKGFFGYIREKISEAADSIFTGLSNQSGVIGTLFQTFSRLAGSVANILVGLAQGNCEPLFASLRQMRDMVTELAGDAWSAISNFFRPIGDYFSDLWQRFGAPVVDWLREVAGDTWAFISGLGRQIWEWSRPVINAIRTFVGDAWSWMKQQLGISDGAGSNEGGLIQWIQEQAQAAWHAIREQLAPVIEPIQGVIQSVREVLPLDAILHFRQTLNGWLQQAAETARNMDAGEGGDVAENQDSLRAILPAILESIQSFRGSLISTGVWVGEKIGQVVEVGQGFISAIARSPIVRGIGAAFGWLNDGLNHLNHWAQQTVQGLFTNIGNALVWLSQFIEPVLNALRRILEVVGNLLGRLPDFLLGPIWWLLPDCIKNPIKNFFIEQILARIPLFQQLMEAGDIWQRVQATALSILRQIFVDGDLMGAAWRFFREMLGLIGIPAQLVVRIIANAAQAISDIIMNPIGFLNNLLRSMWQGATQFFSNILSHLLGGVTGWLFGQIEEAGLTPPDITSFRSIVEFVFDLLGLTLENIWRILAEHVGRPLVDRIRSALEFATGAWEFVRVAVTEGLPGIWRMIQERLSDLWNLVLDSVASWVNSAIVTTASRWLLSLLDATGITPVINALIAVYRAIESFAQYLVQMLEVVNSVVAGLGEIAQGMIQRAADYLESTMAESLPIVIGFLANQFGLGRLGSRVRELVESLRERVNGALSWLIGNAVRLGSGFLDMVRSGVAAVRNWWENRHSFRDSTGQSHQLYFPSERGELTVESDPTPVGRFLSALVIANEDPQRAQKQNHKTRAQAKLNEINRIKTDIARQRRGADTSSLQTQLNQKINELSTHLTPLLGGVGDTNGRLPSPLTLNTLNDPPVTMPRSPEEEQIDLNGARQILLLAVETADGSEALATNFDRIRTRFALSEVSYQQNGDRYAVKLRASREQRVDVNVAHRGTTTGINMASSITHNTGTAAGDTVGISMEADPLGRDKINAGSEPRASALRGVMSKLVTNPSRRSASKYIKGHLLNHNIGGPGDSTNMYPITGAANSAHHSRVESRVKSWIDRQYWVSYRVRVRNITESIRHPNAKHPENFINATFQCEAHIKNLDGSEREAFNDNIISTYSQQDVGGEQVEETAPLNLNNGVRQALDNLSSGSRTAAAIANAVERYNASVASPIGFGSARISAMLDAYRETGDLASWTGARRSALTFVNNRATIIRSVLTSPITTD